MTEMVEEEPFTEIHPYRRILVILFVAIVVALTVITGFFGRLVLPGHVAVITENSWDPTVADVTTNVLVFEWPGYNVELYSTEDTQSQLVLFSRDMTEVTLLTLTVSGEDAITYFRQQVGDPWHSAQHYMLSEHAAMDLLDKIDGGILSGMLPGAEYIEVSSHTKEDPDALAHYIRNDPGTYDHDCEVHRIEIENYDDLVEQYNGPLVVPPTTDIKIDIEQGYEVVMQTELPCGYEPHTKLASFAG